MVTTTTILIAIGLAMDAFAVSLGVGTNAVSNQPSWRRVLRIAFHFGLFQGVMTLLGWLACLTIAELIRSYDHWIAFALLSWVGIRMIRSGWTSDPDCRCEDITRGQTLIVLCIATSIDALAVGLSMAMLSVNIAEAAGLIGIITFGISLFGGFAGQQFGAKFGQRMEILGGMVLIGIGLQIVYTHLLGG